MEILADSPTVPGNVLDSREIPSDVTLVIPLVCRLVERLVQDGCVPDDDRRKVELCLDEAITNAVTHGNDSDFEKMVHVQLYLDGDRWGIVVTDEGEGFTREAVPDLEADEQLWQESGRGIALMCLYMDEVTYFDGGRTVNMVRRCSRLGSGE